MFSSHSKRWLQTWLLVGSLDIGCAFIQAWFKTHTPPDRVLIFIASGLLGKAAFSGGMGTIALGLFCHYCIAGIWVALFWWVLKRFPSLNLYPLICGTLFGFLIWLVMNSIILPLSRTPPLPFSWDRALMAIIILVVAIGLPSALLYPNNRHQKTG